MLWTPLLQRGCGSVLRCCLLTPTASSARRYPLLTSRFSSNSAAAAKSQTESESRGRHVSLSVSPFTTVRAQVNCSISIRALDPHTFPEADRALILVHGPEPTQVSIEQLRVHYDEDSKELQISTKELDKEVSIQMEAPIKSNLFIQTHGTGSVQISSMECDVCEVKTERGDCLLHSVKGHKVQVQTGGGNVIGTGTIHGNVNISTGGYGVSSPAVIYSAVIRGHQQPNAAEVHVKKLQGTKMNVSTERGALKVKATYAESNSFSSNSGNILLGHAHGKTTVRNDSGNTLIDGSNNSLKVSSLSGAIDVYVEDGGAAELYSKEGSVSVRVPSTIKVGVELAGTSVDVEKEIVLNEVKKDSSKILILISGYMNGESAVDQWIKAKADKGSVRLRTQSWFETLKLGG